MGMFQNPLSHAGYPPGVTGTPMTQPSEVRAATVAEANAGTLDNVYISPLTAQAATSLDFASPPVLGFGSTTPRPVHATTLDSSGTTSLSTTAGGVTNIGTTTGTIGFFGATAAVKQLSTTDLRTALINLGLYTTGGASPLDLNGGTLTAATVHGTTVDTNVAAAQLSLNATTLAATGSNTDVNLNLTAKGAGAIIFSQSKAGVDQNMQITNSDNTAAQGNAGLQLAVGGSTSTGDPYVSFQISGVGASTMTMGLDNSASDVFKISNSTAIGTADALTLTQAGALGATTSVTAGTSVTATLGNITATNGDLILGTAGNKLQIHASTAASDSVGTSVALDGASPSQLVVSTTAVKTGSIILLSYATAGGTQGSLSVGTIVDSTSFQIKSSANGDTSTVNYLIIN